MSDDHDEDDQVIPLTISRQQVQKSVSNHLQANFDLAGIVAESKERLQVRIDAAFDAAIAKANVEARVAQLVDSYLTRHAEFLVRSQLKEVCLEEVKRQVREAIDLTLVALIQNGLKVRVGYYPSHDVTLKIEGAPEPPKE